MSFSRAMLVTLCLVAAIAAPAPANALESLFVQAVADTMFDGRPCVVTRYWADGSFEKTQLWLEEAGYVRYYAWKSADDDSFQFYPEDAYLVKSSAMEIGNSWGSWWFGESSVATVIDTQTVDVPAGTFHCYVVQDVIGTAVGLSFFCEGYGLIKREHYDRNDLVTELTDYDPEPLGGSGFFPLAVGNQWEYDAHLSAVSPCTWSRLKAAFGE